MDFVPYIEPLFPAMLMGITGVAGIEHWERIRGKPVPLVSPHDIWTIWHVMAEASQSFRNFGQVTKIKTRQQPGGQSGAHIPKLQEFQRCKCSK